jgi:NAD(P)-dependent dehydrogenase (short-subunit alcohol dehydrogenase family)
MEAQGGGHIINFGQGSIGHGVRPDSLGAAVYHVSKVAIRAFTTEVAAEEQEHNICIVAFGPGGPAGETAEEVREDAARINFELGKRVLAAAEAPMSLTGRMVRVENGRLGLMPDEVE